MQHPDAGTPAPARSVPAWDDYFLGIAQAVGARAKCTRRQVGAVLVIDHRLIATGYNGAAPGRPDCLEGACPRGRLGYGEVPAFSDYDQPGTPGFCIAIHAEVNALLFAVRDTAGAVAYITDEPLPRMSQGPGRRRHRARRLARRGVLRRRARRLVSSIRRP